jgi:ubiquinol-cytochrome c reductase iron-sulfur subunit
MTDDVDLKRRHFLTVATAVTGGVGIAFAAVPFIASLKPSAEALALGAPVEVPIGGLEPGEMIRVMWRGRVVFVLRRSEEMLSRLANVTGLLADPASAKPEQQPEFAVNEYRSLKPEYLVIEGACTHLGCAPIAQIAVGPADDWFGGFFCPCHGSRFDLAGRVYKGVPAPDNMRVPPYRFIREDVIMIGGEPGAV